MLIQALKQRISTLSVPAQVLVLVLIAASLRLVLTLGSAAVIWPDSFAYYRSAALMAKSGNYVWHEIYRTPLYPFFLSLFLRIEESLFVGSLIVFAQRCLGIGTIVLFFLSGRKVFNPVVAFVGALLLALHTLQLYYETVIQTEVLFVFLLAVVTYLTLCMLDIQTYKRAICLGISAALLILARPIGQPVFVLSLLVLALRLKNAKTFLAMAVTAVISCAVLLLPWMMINKKHYGFFGVSQDLGLNLFHRIIDVERLEPPADSKYPLVRDLWERVANQPGVTYFKVYHGLIRKKVKPVRADRMLSHVALEALKAEPWSFPWTSARIFSQLLTKPRNSVFICAAENGPLLCVPKRINKRLPAFERPPAHLKPWAQNAVAWYFRNAELPIALISLLGLLGMLLIARKDPYEARFLFMVGLVFYFTGVSALMNVPEDRFRLPIDAILFMFALESLRMALAYFRPVVSTKSA
ncbi:MAG: glycosyltransferase family 39 protein [Oligoflexia bacterium]|nr:glycosyltransferase family 39 protein [Oligoflexia bacterium]